ncbi:MAG: FHA domain-containing protein [Pseudonocardia sp.]
MAVGSAWARVGIEAGDGLVARFGDVVILIAAGTTAQDAAAVDLLEALATAETPPGAAVAASLAAILTGRPPAEIPAFGVVAPVDGGLVVLLRGAVTAEALGQDTVHRLSGRQALTWVDRVIELPVKRIMLTCSAGRATAPHPRSDLREGVVPGHGFLVTVGSVVVSHDGGPPPGTSAALSTSRDDIDTAPAPDTGGSAEGPPTNGRDEPTSTEPSAQAPDQPPPTPPRTAPAHQTMVAKAPLGALVADGGSPRILLDRAYVIGRDPHNDPAVRGAQASPIVVHDPDNLISRVHVYASVDGGELILRDAGSATGTYIAAPGAESWTTIGAEPTSLPPGWSVRLGKRIFTFVAMGAQPQQP